MFTFRYSMKENFSFKDIELHIEYKEEIEFQENILFFGGAA